MPIRNLQQSKSSLVNEIQQKRRNESAKIFRSLYHQYTYVGERRHKNGFFIIEKRKPGLKKSPLTLLANHQASRVTFRCRNPSEM